MVSGNALSANSVSQTFSGVRDHIQGMQSFGAQMLTHGGGVVLAALQFAGFTLAILFVYTRLRKLPYCNVCEVFLSGKGSQTRYYDSEREVQGMVDEFLSRAKARRFRESIQAHASEGSARKTHLSSFASTVKVSRCKACPKHRLEFTARRKAGMSWKDISMLGYATNCMETITIHK